jgi:hypothetical protein
VKIETMLFGSGLFFFTPVALIYGLLSGWEAVGTAGLLLTAGLAALIGGYLWVTARRIDPRPEDDPQGEIAEGAGEQGFYSPHSWWPLPLALSGAVVFLGLVIGWWMFYIGAAIGVVSLVGWVYEYYRGAHAH